MSLTVSDVLGKGRSKQRRSARIVFDVENLSVECECLYERLNPKNILPFEEFEQTTDGRRVKAKLVGYNRGDKRYFEAKQDEKGKWVANEEKPLTEGVRIDKALLDKRTGEVSVKDTQKGIKYLKTAPAGIVSDWHREEVFNIWSEDNSDILLKIYNYLLEKNEVGVYRFNPNGTAYNAFLIPQRVDGGRFRLLLHTARVKMNKPEITPTMVIKGAENLEKERERVDKILAVSALEEV